MAIDYVEYSKIFKVFADPKRLKIIDMLSNGELCACKILEEFQITKPTLSHDMKLLSDIGIVSKNSELHVSRRGFMITITGVICAGKK